MPVLPNSEEIQRWSAPQTLNRLENCPIAWQQQRVLLSPSQTSYHILQTESSGTRTKKLEDHTKITWY